MFGIDSVLFTHVNFTNISYIGILFKDRFIQYSRLFMVWFMQVTLYLFSKK